MRKITIDMRQVVGWYNVIAKLLIDAQIPASPETMQAMGLLYASQLRVRDFELSEAVKAFKNMWSLDAACTSTVDGQIIPPHVTTAAERKELRFSEPALEAQIASDEAPESDGTLAAEREKLQAATRAALGVDEEPEK